MTSARPFSIRLIGMVPAVLAMLPCAAAAAAGAPGTAADRFRREVEPILVNHCYDCHADGVSKGNVAFDAAKSPDALAADRELWWKVLKNVRAGVMPPAKKPRLSADELATLERWVKRDALALDPANPDPGRVTLRRLNRAEYRNTIRDLMGIDFRADEEFPPDDTGYGFDNIGDVLTVSPLLLEKYVQAAEQVVAAAVPTVSRVVGEAVVSGREFRGDGGVTGNGMTFYKPAAVSHAFKVEQSGSYKLVVELTVRGAFDFDPGRCDFRFSVNGKQRLGQEFVWQDGKKYRFETDEQFEAGEQKLTFELKPLVPEDQRKTSVDMRIDAVRVRGPLEPAHWVRPPNFDKFFTRDAPPAGPERTAYAREVLGRFATRAFRRPADERTIDRLVAIAEEAYAKPGVSAEQGLARAMVAVLASPRFVFRVEQTEPVKPGELIAPVDEHALAARLSYFLWSSTPDDELLNLAARGELRNHLPVQVKRLLADPRANALTENFVGQWLQARDAEGISIDARSVLARDNGQEKELQKQMEELAAIRAQLAKDPLFRPPTTRRRIPRPATELDGSLRAAMRREAEMFFAHMVREDRPVLDLLDSDYTFLNEKLAKHYGVPDVSGDEMRRVALPPGSPRGGVLTMGAVLAVTSNPTRTSPVKRGVFILDNILGTPTPPPPPDIPELEEAEKGFGDREPTMREVMEIHRSNALCSSCHSRMDPLGLALENFNAMGMWRERERNQPIDSAGRLASGETFDGVRALKRVLKDDRRQDFYRCLTEKMLTYALGRGMEYNDVETVDQIVGRLEKADGRFSALLTGVIESAAFQKRRNAPPAAPPATAPADKSQGHGKVEQ